jgi:hypothetical protein
LGDRPVKLVPTNDGGMGSYAFNWKTGEFDLNWDVYLEVSKPGSDAEIVAEVEFEKYVNILRNKLLPNQERDK